MTIDELVARTDVPVISADHRGYITSINEQFRHAYGWEAADLIGQPLPTIIPGNLHDAHHMGFSRFLTTGRPTLLEQPLSLRIMTKDGRELEAEHFIVAEQLGGDWAFAASITPLP